MFLKKMLVIGALLVGGVVTSLATPDTADARPRRYYRGGYYGSYYRPYNYGYRSYGYQPYYYGRSYYGRPYDGGYGYGYPYGYGYGGYGGGVYIGRGGVSIGW